jgi:hypothetical protein
MKINPAPKFDGPIPGANLTAETRNYPWHRPPDHTDFNVAVTALLAKLGQRKEIELAYSLIELEVPVFVITSNFLMRQIMRGVIAIDLAILAAGPVARYIEIMAKDNGQKPDMTTEDPRSRPITPTLLKLQMGQVDDLADVKAKPKDDGIGLMAAAPNEIVDVASSDEQMAMLGGVNDEEMA